MITSTQTKLTNDYEQAGYVVCTRLTLSQFGGKTPLGDRGDYDMDYNPYAKTFEEFKGNLRKAVNVYEKGLWKTAKENAFDDDDEELVEEPDQLVHRMAFVEAVTSVPGQEHAELFLEQLGFTKVGPFSKEKHNYTKVSVWLMHAPAFLKAIKEI